MWKPFAKSHQVPKSEFQIIIHIEISSKAPYRLYQTDPWTFIPSFFPHKLLHHYVLNMAVYSKTVDKKTGSNHDYLTLPSLILDPHCAVPLSRSTLFSQIGTGKRLRNSINIYRKQLISFK